MAVVESTLTLGSLATFDGTAYVLNVAPPVSPGGLWAPRCFFRVFADADQAGTLNVQQSMDGVTWYTTDTASVSASTPKIIESTWTLNYVRVQYVNGATAQGAFLLTSQLVVEGADN